MSFVPNVICDFLRSQAVNEHSVKILPLDRVYNTTLWNAQIWVLITPGARKKRGNMIKFRFYSQQTGISMGGGSLKGREVMQVYCKRQWVSEHEGGKKNKGKNTSSLIIQADFLNIRLKSAHTKKKINK